MLLPWHIVRRAVERRLQRSRPGYLPWDMGHEVLPLPVDFENRSVDMTFNEVSVDALDWLYNVSSNPVVERIVIMAIGGLPASVQQYAASTWRDTWNMAFTRWDILKESTHWQKVNEVLACLPGSECTLERLFRSHLFLPAPVYWPETIIHNTGNARFDLALAITPMVRRTPIQIRELFIESHKVAVHPLVWSKFVTLAAFNGAFRLSDPKVTSGAHARFIAVMLPEYYSPSPPNDTVSPDTLRHALKVCPPPALWDYLLEMPALMAFDVGPSSSSSTSVRALLAAAKFALHHIDEGHTLPEVDIDVSSLASEAQSHWTLLEAVLRYLTSVCYHMDEPTLVLRDEVMQLLEQIIVLEAFRHLDSPSVLIHLLDGCQHEAYCLFVQDEWIQRVGPLWIAGWDWAGFTTEVLYPAPEEQIIDSYISGLTSLSMAVSRQQFVDHLYDPENLAIALCVVFPDAGTLRSLIALNPTHSSWDRCRTLLESIIAWNRSPDRENTEFPGDYLLGSKIVQCSDRSVSLEEDIRRRFTGEEAGKKLDMAMQVLNESLPVAESSRPQ
ncbi:hypothetical protein BDZ89DRAFT_1109559 [Hymenopellis radicata]|nr:hypothetical protein BDZ89DRAFT_1112080 [Hymenopellis radicata]KAF9042644.1 hypothetical protein BDZ89DRAFT_1109559 [Hymenopellis radicata]